MLDTTVFQSAMKPLQKLAQSNLELLTTFSMSPEVTSQAMSDVQKLVEQTQDSAMKLAQSRAFAGMIQGFVENYTAFLTEVSQNATTIATQAQAGFMKQATEATSGAIEATQTGARRQRNAA